MIENTTEFQQMPCWYYEKTDLRKTPSFLDGINAETEARYRREGPRFIFDMGTRLGLHHDTIATGQVFFHRFYMFHSFKKFPRHITATCCLFLAGKVEETPKKCKDLVKVARGLLNDAQFAQFGEDSREEVLTFEKVLLQTIKFDLTVEHPYKYMLKYAKALKGDRAKIEKLVQMAWTFINDSLCTSLCLQWEPQIVAVAVMYLAGRLCKFEPQDWAINRGKWWEQFISDISMELLEDICHQVLDQYSHTKGGKSSGKAKRERPKTPGEGEKSAEPQAKTLRGEKLQQKKKVQTTSAKKATVKSKPTNSDRRSSSNTEVVAMETVDTLDRGTIEQGKPQLVPNKLQTPTKPPPTSSETGSYYSGINQYQTFMGNQTFNDPNMFYPTTQSFVTQNPPYYPPIPGGEQQIYPPPTTGYYGVQGGNPVPSNSATGLATVRITGRRENPSNPPYS